MAVEIYWDQVRIEGGVSVVVVMLMGYEGQRICFVAVTSMPSNRVCQLHHR